MGRVDNELEQQLVENLDLLLDLEVLQNEDNWELLDTYEETTELVEKDTQGENS